MKNFKIITLVIIAAVSISLFNSCGKSKRRVTFDTQPVSIHQYETPPGADPSVPADLGGEGFTGEGWETSTDYHLFGDENAEKGGSLIMSVQDFPATLRTVGKDANTTVNFMMETMMYEGLLNLDPVTEEYIPLLATHWQISEDKMSYRFRINPNARWADGMPVTSEDVIATWKLQVDPGILEAYSNILYGSYEEPVAESKYIVSVRSKELNWRQFLYFSASMRILPAHYIGNINGSQYLEKYQFDFVPGSGPYLIRLEDINKGQSIMIRRRSDYWAENERFNTGLNNFDLVRFEVNQDQSLEFEKFKKGEIDVIVVNRAQWWEERFDFPEYERGIILKRRIFNEYPNGVQGIAFNMRKPPFDDLKLRQAFAHLFNREMFNEKLFYNSYSMTYSFWPGSVYENPDNPKIDFNTEKARTLLSESGWSEKNRDGYLVKDGRIFEIELTFASQGADRYLTIFQEDLRNAGIKLNLRLIDGPTNFRLGNERNFSIISAGWGGLVIPNPESSMSSATADEPNTTNWPGIKDERIDELLKKYNIEFDKDERIKIIREIDYIATNKYPYIFNWYGPYQRIAIQNKFGYPDWYLPRTDNYLAIPSLWWNDPEKAAEYEDAKKDNSITLEKGEVDQKFWTKVRSKLEAGESIDLNAIGAGSSE